MSLDFLCIWQAHLYVYSTWQHYVFNPVAPYGHLLTNVYLFMADIANPDLFVGPGFVSASSAS